MSTEPLKAAAPPILSRILRKYELESFVGVSRTAIEEMIDSGEFPEPIRINNHGRILGWLESELIDWQQKRKKLRDSGRAPRPKKSPVPPRREGPLSNKETAVAARKKREANKKRGARR
jgi:predicted DNA-binding transcriptional regulator AlpA